MNTNQQLLYEDGLTRTLSETTHDRKRKQEGDKYIPLTLQSTILLELLI